MRDDMEEMMQSWCFTKEVIENTPSRRDGISADDEAHARMQYCQFIRWMCSQFKLDTIPTATALMFCHRFYVLQSLAKNDWKTIATACVFLSSKSEDCFRSLDDIVRVAFDKDMQNLSNNQQKVFLQKKRKLIELAENVLLVNLRFDTNVTHPYRSIHNAMKLLGINSKEHRREVWKLVNCWLDTTLCLEYKPVWIAAASLHIADKLHDWNLSDIKALLALWSEKIVPEKWDECISQMVQILCMHKWPQYAKLTDRLILSQAEPVPERKPKLQAKPEPKLKHETLIQKLSEPELGSDENKPKIVTPDSVLDLAEAASKMPEDAPKRDTVILNPSTSSEGVPEEKAPERKRDGLCKVLDKAYIAHIRDAIKKRKSTAEIFSPVGMVKMDASSGGLDDWIERELESGIILESNSVCKEKMDEQKTKFILPSKCDESDDSWIEKELEEGIIVDFKPVSHNKLKGTGESSAALKLGKYHALKQLRLLKREREAEVTINSKRQRR